MNARSSIKSAILNKFARWGSVAVVVLAASPVLAQSHSLVDAPSFSNPVPFVYAGSHGYGGWGGVGTAYSAAVHSQADVIRARGENALLAGQAARHFQEARSRALDNVVKEMATRQERERMGLARQEAQRQERKETAARLMARRDRQERSVESASEQELRASSRLFLARKLIENGKGDTGREWLEEIVGQHSGTVAAVEAGELLAQLR